MDQEEKRKEIMKEEFVAKVKLARIFQPVTVNNFPHSFFSQANDRIKDAQYDMVRLGPDMFFRILWNGQKTYVTVNNLIFFELENGEDKHEEVTPPKRLGRPPKYDVSRTGSSFTSTP